MRLFIHSDIFANYINKGDAIQKKIFDIASGKIPTVILNTELNEDIERLNRKRSVKEPTLLKAITAVKANEIIFIKLSPEDRLPDFLPYFKYKKNGKDRVIVDVSKYLIEEMDPTTNKATYRFSDINVLYTFLMSSYVYLRLFDESTVLPPDAIKYSAAIWARLFTQIIFKSGMITNSDRRDAFVFFAMKFFMKYYLDTNELIAESIAVNYQEGGVKNQIINDMEYEIDSLGLNPYDSFVDFCTTMFNNQVTNIKGLRVKNVENSINVSFFIDNFRSMYGNSALMSLCAYPFFIMLVFDGLNGSNICRDRGLENVVKYDMKEITKLVNSLYRELK
jgi:hypothetical protein